MAADQSPPRLTADDYQQHYDDDNTFYLHCYPLSCIDKSHMENGNKIIMPASILHIIMSSGNVNFPMTFEISNMETGNVSHCGVLEFSSEEGVVWVPNWMMDNLSLQDGQCVKFTKTEALAKATYIKIQPHSFDFIKNLSDPKAVLEKILKDFACLTIGDTIMVNHEDKSYYIDILETSPENAVSLFETDCEVDFAPPLDYKEPPKEEHKEDDQVKAHTELGAVSSADFTPFTGECRRLDGQTSSTSSTCVIPKHDEMTKVVNANSKKYAGTVVFGRGDSDGGENKKRKITKMMEDVEQKNKIDNSEEKKFQPFTGKKYKLSDS